MLAAFKIHKKHAKPFFDFLCPYEQKEDGSELLDNRLTLSFNCEKNLQFSCVPDSAAYYTETSIFTTLL